MMLIGWFRKILLSNINLFVLLLLKFCFIRQCDVSRFLTFVFRRSNPVNKERPTEVCDDVEGTEAEVELMGCLWGLQITCIHDL